MENDREEPLYAYLERRERELTAQLSALKGQVAARETELAHVRSAQRIIGNLGGDDQKRFGVPEKPASALSGVAVALGVASKQFSDQMTASGKEIAEALQRVMGTSEIPTIKQLIVRALYDHFITTGATASELRQYIQDAYGRTVTHASISPQLSRLKADGALQHSVESDKWKLADFQKLTVAKMIARDVAESLSPLMSLGKDEAPSVDKSEGAPRVTDGGKPTIKRRLL